MIVIIYHYQNKYFVEKHIVNARITTLKERYIQNKFKTSSVSYTKVLI